MVGLADGNEPYSIHLREVLLFKATSSGDNPRYLKRDPGPVAAGSYT